MTLFSTSYTFGLQVFTIISTNNGETICEGFGAKFVRDIAAGSCGNKKLVIVLSK